MPPASTRRALAAGVVMPALRWDGTAYRPHGDTAPPEELIDLGVAGFILFGGTAPAARALTETLRARTDRPLLFGSDLERGAGQQFDGATRLPPLGALGSLDDLRASRGAGEVTAREARALGVGLVFAPVADVAAEPENPIVGPRAFGGDPQHAARHVAAWVEGAAEGGAHACVKHFPGHGRTVGDSHVGAVRIDADRETLMRDLAPVRAAIAAGVRLVMPGHLAAPALDSEGRIATMSPPMLQDLLRGELGFEGVVVSDALLMGGAGQLRDTAVAALLAGVDLLLYPEDPAVAIDALASAAAESSEVRARLEEAGARVRSLVLPEPGPAEVGTPQDEARAAGWARASIRRVRGDGPAPGPDVPLKVVDIEDDVGGPYPPSARSWFREGLGHDAGARDRVIAVWADTRGWKGRAGLSAERAEELKLALEGAGSDDHVVVFGGSRVVDDIPAGPTVWLAWGGEPLMQREAARRLREGAGG